RMSTRTAARSRLVTRSAPAAHGSRPPLPAISYARVGGMRSARSASGWARASRWCWSAHERSAMNLESYVQGRWQAGTGDAITLRDATTGEPVAVASSGGVDFRRALDTACQWGGPAVR